MTDKVRIDTLSANSLPQSNDTFLARQAEFESNVRSYPRKLPLAIAKAQGVWITDVENNQYLDCWQVPEPRRLVITILKCCRAFKVSSQAAYRYIRLTLPRR